MHRIPIRSDKLLFLTLAGSIALILLALAVEADIQGTFTVPGEMNVRCFIPGKYEIYQQVALDEKKKPDIFIADNGLNENLAFNLSGCGHLDKIKPQVLSTGGRSYFRQDDSSKNSMGIPIAEFEILWPGVYKLRIEFSSWIDKHPEITVGLTGLVPECIIICLFFQVSALIVVCRRELEQKALKKKEKASHC